MVLLDILTFLGHLHPLMVHLPIGFLLLAAIFNVLSYIKKYEHLHPAVSFSLLTGFISAVLACIFGYILSRSGDYDRTLLHHHKVAGFVLTAVSGLLFLLTMPRVRVVLDLPPRFFSFFLLGLIVLLSYAGHQGGNLTHGSDYLDFATLMKHQRPAPASVEEAMIFEDVVSPILEKKCAQCHGGSKLKGRLSVETLRDLLKGGKSGPAVLPGKPDESELFKRITLDPGHKKYMPADGKPPLTRSEVAIIGWWIGKAGAVEGKKLADLKDKGAIRGQIASFLGIGGADASADTAGSLVQSINPDIPVSLDASLIDQLRKKGLTVRVMLQRPVMLDVTLPAGSGKKISDIKDDIMRAGKNIIWLNLSDNGLTDGDLGFLKQLPNLEKLRLEKNPLTDGVTGDLAGLKHLTAVNLTETKISNSGLALLEKNPALKRIYTWKTAVTAP